MVFVIFCKLVRHTILLEKYIIVSVIMFGCQINSVSYYSLYLSIHKVAALKQELQRTKAALDIANRKLTLKEELASTAMAAQAAAERSLQLADSRAVELRQRIEDLTRHLEEVGKRERNSRKMRRICWPWQVFKLSFGSSASDARVGNVKRMLPEMQALVH